MHTKMNSSTSRGLLQCVSSVSNATHTWIHYWTHASTLNTAPAPLPIQYATSSQLCNPLSATCVCTSNNRLQRWQRGGVYAGSVAECALRCACSVTAPSTEDLIPLHTLLSATPHVPSLLHSQTILTQAWLTRSAAITLHSRVCCAPRPTSGCTDVCRPMCALRGVHGWRSADGDLGAGCDRQVMLHTAHSCVY
jgi:hypothetical protein